MEFKNTLLFAQHLDLNDPLRSFRNKFYIPLIHGKECIYFTGNSLGLQPKTVKKYVDQELEDWARMGVEGHLLARNPWLPYHELFPQQISKIVGSMPEEVVVMNQLTVNLHLLMVSFYRPTQQRYKIICEAKAFPSDQYAMESQVMMAGFNPEEAIIEVNPREGEHTIRTEDILKVIDENNDSVALVLFGGVNYYTGQVFDMKSITAAAHEVGAYAGFDLAHAIGNVPLHLHDWDVDFACWCSYKYLNSGPGGVAGVFINYKHASNPTFPRFAGWWGYTKKSRFNMEKGFEAIPTAEGWQMSNAPILSMAAHKASLDLFEEADMENLLDKMKLLSGFLHFVLHDINNKQPEKIIEIITPDSEEERGCQVSIFMLKKGKEVFKELTAQGVIADWREPNVIRVAPVPMYNSYEEVWKFGNLIERILGN